MGTDAWIVVTAVANAILGAISLFLLLQGQNDRRRIADDRRADQAKRVTISVEQLSERLDAHSYSIPGLRVVIRNDSDRPIFFGPMPTVSLYTRPCWRSAADGGNDAGAWKTEHLNLPLGRIDPGTSLEPTSESTIVDSARIEFTDAEGNRWVRTSDDGQLFLVSHHPAKRSIAFQALCRIKLFELFLMKWPHRYASWRFTRTVTGVPLTARVIRFWWGYVPIGEPTPWMLPSGAPADWPYSDWASTVRSMAAVKSRTHPDQHLEL